MEDISANVTTLATVSGCAGKNELWQSKGAQWIELCIFPVVIIVGSVLNILAFAVLQSRTYRGTSTGFLMTALSLTDLGLLLTGILRMWIMALTGGQVDIRSFSSASCKLHIFFTYAFQYVSSWTLALLTIERSISVRMPFHCKELCSLRKIVFGWIVILIVVIGVNAHFFVTYDLIDFGSTSVCHGLTRYRVFLYEGPHNWIDLLFPCVGPFTVIIVCNGLIVSKLIQGVAARKHMTASTVTSPRTSSTTVMLLVVSTMFLILMSPFAIYSLGGSFQHWSYDTARDCAVQDFVYTVTYLLFNVNSAINFLLYYASGSKFRRVMKTMFRPKQRDVPAATSTASNSRQTEATQL